VTYHTRRFLRARGRERADTERHVILGGCWRLAEMPRRAKHKAPVAAISAETEARVGIQSNDGVLVPSMPRVARKKRQKMDDRLSEREKDHARRSNNRSAAQKLRDRKKTYEQDLEHQETVLQEERTELTVRDRELTVENQELRHKVRIMSAIIDQVRRMQAETTADTQPGTAGVEGAMDVGDGAVDMMETTPDGVDAVGGTLEEVAENQASLPSPVPDTSVEAPLDLGVDLLADAPFDLVPVPVADKMDPVMDVKVDQAMSLGGAADAGVMPQWPVEAPVEATLEELLLAGDGIVPMGPWSMGGLPAVSPPAAVPHVSPSPVGGAEAMEFYDPSLLEGMTGPPETGAGRADEDICVLGAPEMSLAGVPLVSEAPSAASFESAALKRTNPLPSELQKTSCILYMLGLASFVGMDADSESDSESDLEGAEQVGPFGARAAGALPRATSPSFPRAGTGALGPLPLSSGLLPPLAMPNCLAPSDAERLQQWLRRPDVLRRISRLVHRQLPGVAPLHALCGPSCCA